MREKKSNSEAEIIKKLTELQQLLQRKGDLAYRQASKPLNFKEACAYLGFAPSYLYKLTYKKIIPHYKPTGKIIFFSKIELDEWVFGKGQGPESGDQSSTPNGGQAEVRDQKSDIRDQKSEVGGQKSDDEESEPP